jgi:hypothetical protein
LAPQQPFDAELPNASVRFAEPPSVEGTVTWQLVPVLLETLEPPTAALVVTFAAWVEVSAVSPGNCRADWGLVDAGAVIEAVAPAPVPIAGVVDPPVAPPPPMPGPEDGSVWAGKLNGSDAILLPLSLV